MITSLEQARKKGDGNLGKLRNYNEIVDYLNALKPAEYGDASLRRMKELDQQFNNVCSKIDTVTVGGTNGKSSTIHFAAKLLREEGFKVGSVLSTHVLTYNERIALNFEAISNKVFADIVNEVINVADAKDRKSVV